MRPELRPEQAAYVNRLVDRLRAQRIAPEAIVESFATVPRHWFVERLYRWDRDRGGFRPEAAEISPASLDPALLDAVYADAALSIQLSGGVCTASTSQPSLMAQMMVDVNLGPGCRVLEIGTATGWNAALLAEIVGPGGRVVTIEVDPDLAGRAATRLAAYGWERIDCRCGDGFDGVADAAPYDAIIATMGCPDLPRAWLAQLAEGGRLVCPLALPDGSAPLLKLVRRGNRYAGQVVRWAWFVQARGQRWQAWPPPLRAAENETLAHLLRRRPRRAELPWEAAGDGRAVGDLALWLLLRQPPRLIWLEAEPGGGREAARPALVDLGWTGLATLHGDHAIAFGEGESLHRLLDEADRWVRHGAPTFRDWVVTVNGDSPLRIVRRETTLSFKLAGRP